MNYERINQNLMERVLQYLKIIVYLPKTIYFVYLDKSVFPEDYNLILRTIRNEEIL
jgi:hypothetical protein